MNLLRYYCTQNSKWNTWKIHAKIKVLLDRCSRTLTFSSANWLRDNIWTIWNIWISIIIIDWFWRCMLDKWLFWETIISLYYTRCWRAGTKRRWRKIMGLFNNWSKGRPWLISCTINYTANSARIRSSWNYSRPSFSRKKPTKMRRSTIWTKFCKSPVVLTVNNWMKKIRSWSP